MNQMTINTQEKKKSLVKKIADRYSVDGEKMLDTLKSTAFKQRDGSAPSNEQMMALLVVADQYNLNPFTREIYAFPDKQNGIVPVVGVDGWSRIINSHPQFDGMEYRYSEEMVTPDGAKSECHVWVECVMYRKDRSRPVVAREYLDEVYRPPFKKTGSNGPYVIEGPWQTHPKRFLRHKATIQCSRLAFGFVGIFDPDEADRIAGASAETQEPKDITPEPRATWDNDQFAKQLEQIRPTLERAEQSPEEAINWFYAKHDLTEGQIAAIKQCAPLEGVSE